MIRSNTVPGNRTDRRRASGVVSALLAALICAVPAGAEPKVVISDVKGTFEGQVPLEYGKRPLQLRARLTHKYGGPYAAWSAQIFRHDTWAIAPNLQAHAVIDPTDPKLGDPEILRLTEALRKARKRLAELRAALATQQARLKVLEGKMWSAMNKGIGIPDSGATVGGTNYADKAGDIITSAGGGPSILANECPVIGTRHWGKQVDMYRDNIAATEKMIAARQKKIGELQAKLNKLKAAKGR